MDSAELDVCTEPYAKMSATMKAFEGLLKSKVDAETGGLEREAQALQEEASDFAEEQQENRVWLKFDTWMADTSILLPVIEVTMKNTEFWVEVPEFTYKTTELSLKIPEVTFVLKKTGEIPHTKTEWKVKDLGFGVKTKVPVTTVWWEPIMTKVPEMIMKDRSIKLDLPQVTMKRRDVVLKLPQIVFSQKEIVMKLPQFRLISIAINFQTDQDGADRLEQRGKELESRSAKAVSEAMGEAVNETEQQVTADVHAFFECQRNQIAGLATSSNATFDALTVGLQVAQANLLAQVGQGTGHEATLAHLAKSIQDLAEQRAGAAAGFEKQIAELIEAEKATLEDFLRNLSVNSFEQQAA